MAFKMNSLFNFTQIWNSNLPITIEQIVNNVELRGDVCSRLNSYPMVAKNFQGDHKDLMLFQ